MLREWDSWVLLRPGDGTVGFPSFVDGLRIGTVEFPCSVDGLRNATAGFSSSIDGLGMIQLCFPVLLIDLVRVKLAVQVILRFGEWYSWVFKLC